MYEVTYKCKNCGFDQGFVRNPNPEFRMRVVCQRCGCIIVRKPRSKNKQPPKSKNTPKEEPIWILNKYRTHCRKCRRDVDLDEWVEWTPGKRGIVCEECVHKVAA